MSLTAVHVVSNCLTHEQYAALEKRLGALANPQINGGTTELEAGQKLGVQLVLQLLRNGWAS